MLDLELEYSFVYVTIGLVCYSKTTLCSSLVFFYLLQHTIDSYDECTNFYTIKEFTNQKSLI